VPAEPLAGAAQLHKRITKQHGGHANDLPTCLAVHNGDQTSIAQHGVLRTGD
jgi:hypothetical protein